MVGTPGTEGRSKPDRPGAALRAVTSRACPCEGLCSALAPSDESRKGSLLNVRL